MHFKSKTINIKQIALDSHVVFVGEYIITTVRRLKAAFVTFTRVLQNCNL